MLNPLQVQNLQTGSGKSLPAAELVRALPLNTPTSIRVQQSLPTPGQAGQFTLQVQLGSQLFQLNSNQNLAPGTTATLTRTTVGQLLLTPTAVPAQPLPQQTSNTSQQLPNQPATTQQKPIQAGTAPQQTLPGQGQPAQQQPIPPVIQQRQTTQQNQQPPPAPPSAKQPAQAPTQQPQPATLTATLSSRPTADLNQLLPLNRPVLATVSQQITTASTPAGQTQINASINGHSVQLNLSQPLSFDGKVLLIRNAANQVALQPLTAPAQNQVLQQTINSALRHVLPAQRTVAESLQQIQTLSTASGADRQAINGILSALISLFGIKPDGSAESRGSILQNLHNGGLFTERQLASPGKPDLSLDFKHQLSQLLKQADKLPEQPRQQLQELVQGLLSRVTSHQLESIQNTRVSTDGGIERFFALDLPIRYKDQLDNVELKISEHRRQGNDHEWQSLWKVRLHFDLETLGTVDAELILEQDYQITAHFWCSHADTAEAFNEQLPQFNRQLHEQGYIINAVHCSEGSAPKPGNAVEQLIDVTT